MCYFYGSHKVLISKHTIYVDIKQHMRAAAAVTISRSTNSACAISVLQYCCKESLVVVTRGSTAAESTARPSCLVDVLYGIFGEKICWRWNGWLIVKLIYLLSLLRGQKRAAIIYLLTGLEQSLKEEVPVWMLCCAELWSWKFLMYSLLSDLASLNK